MSTESVYTMMYLILVITDIPAVITLAPVDFSGEMKTFDGYKLGDALKLLEDEGAACVGLNCARGPETIIPLIRDIRKQIKVKHSPIFLCKSE